jgi:predicted small lipoprotein YifL
MDYMNKLNILSLSTLSAILIGLSGCGAKGPQFTTFEKPREGKSLIYIYRNGNFFGGGVQPQIHKTDLESKFSEDIGKIEPSGYIKTEADSGKSYEIWAKTEVTNSVKLNSIENKVYCIQHYITPGFFVGHPQFELQDLEKCETEIKKTKLSLQTNEDNEKGLKNDEE